MITCLVHADPRDQRIAQLEGEVAELKGLLRTALARIEVLEAKNAELQARLDQNSNNSSKPPSSDVPGTPRSPKKPPTGRKPGGQPGHEKSGRELTPVDQVKEVVDLVPDRCGKCLRRLSGRDEKPFRHQQVELPPMTAEVTEYRCHELSCPCGAVTRAVLPPEAASVFGIRLSAMVSALMVQYRLSKRLTQRLLADALHIDISLGMLPKLGAEMGKALAGPAAEAEHTFANNSLPTPTRLAGTRARRTGATVAHGCGPSRPAPSSSSASPSAEAATW